MPPRKRARLSNGADEAAAPAAEEQMQAKSEQMQARRGDMAQIARRRAAHFANFKDEDDDDDGTNVHVGTDNARTLGPWSSAVELVNERDKAVTAREDKIAKRNAMLRAEALQVAWDAKRDPSLGPRGTDRVPPLMKMCLDLLVEHVDAVESFVGLPDAIKGQIAKAVAANRNMTSQVANLLVEGGWSEVDIPDCTQLNAEDMVTLVQGCASPRLERLELGACGRGFSQAASEALRTAGPFRHLNRLTLAGAYRLSDSHLEAVLSAMPHLTHLRLPDASQLTGGLLRQLPALCSQLTVLDISNCRGLDADSLSHALQQLPALHTVCLRGILEVSDEVLSRVAMNPCLRHLDVACCKAITDSGVEGVASRRKALQGLVLDECPLVSDASLWALAASCKGLMELSLRRCSKLSDKGVAAVAENGSLQQLHCSNVVGVGVHTMKALALHCKDSLQELDVSFCRDIPEKAFGLVADSCRNLRKLVVYGCTQISKDVVYGHSNDGLEILGTPPLNGGQ